MLDLFDYRYSGIRISGIAVRFLFLSNWEDISANFLLTHTPINLETSYEGFLVIVVCIPNTVEPRFNEVAGDRPNLFVKSRVRYIENLDITNLRGNDQDVRYIEVIVND